MNETEYLFHGSHADIADTLEPRISFHDLPLVYATTDAFYALARCGNFTEDILIREDYKDGHYSLCELEEGAFERVFNCDGYIYVVKSDGFREARRAFQDGMDNEYISDVPQKYTSRVYIPNIWVKMMEVAERNPEYFEFITYENADETYWSHVPGGREGYLARREARKK